MLFWFIKAILISSVIIFLIHNIFLFLSETLTIPKVKDLVQISNNNYENIYNILSQPQIQQNLNTDETTPIHLLPNSLEENIIEEDANIKNELKSYLKEQINL